ncbi:MAG: hypothetical protein AAGD04_03560 [Pseudomonadota bacterium]
MTPKKTLLVMGCTLVLSLGVAPAVSITETAEARPGGIKGGFNKAAGVPKAPVFKAGKKGGLAGVKPAKPAFNKASGAKVGGGAKAGGAKSGGKKKGLAGVKPVKPLFNKASGAKAQGGGGGKGLFQKPANPGSSPKRLKPIFNPAANPPKKPGKGDPPPNPNGPKFPAPKFKPPGI